LTSSPEKADKNQDAARSDAADKNSASQAKASQNTPASLRKALKECMMRDRFRLSKRIAGASRIKNEKSKHAVFDEIALDIAQSMMTATQRAAQQPTIE
jgi:ATP-dependent helicase HrpA